MRDAFSNPGREMRQAEIDRGHLRRDQLQAAGERVVTCPRPLMRHRGCCARLPQDQRDHGVERRWRHIRKHADFDWSTPKTFRLGVVDDVRPR